MATVAVYYAVLLAAVGMAVWRGGRFERWAAFTALLASVATTLVTPRPAWAEVEVEIFAIDVVALCSFWLVALRSPNYWPYWITGWQLISVLGHIQKLMFPEIMARPYALVTMYISYPILFLILYVSMARKRADGVVR